MPFVENLGARIHWDEEGSGAPLLLIMGLGWSSHAWHRTRPVLSEKYRTIALDNRGVGRSVGGMGGGRGVRGKCCPSADGSFADLQAIRAGEAYSGSGQISARALVLHGENDRLVPPENARQISARIPGAKLVMLPKA